MAKELMIEIERSSTEETPNGFSKLDKNPEPDPAFFVHEGQTTLSEKSDKSNHSGDELNPSDTSQSIDVDISQMVKTTVRRVDLQYAGHQNKTGWLPVAGMSLRALGVIYGDIGTSPLYVWSSIFTSPPTESDVVGALSLIIWSLILIVCVKYITLVLRVDNHGEGGIFALMSMLPARGINPYLRNFLVSLALIGSAFIVGDGIITPAISVLGAIEGLNVVVPAMAQYEDLLGVIILAALFLGQRFGTSKIGVTFGPIMVVWFILIAIWGIMGIAESPSVLKAFSPHYGILFLANGGSNGFFILAVVVLAVTGVEALYADMGHFGILPIRLSWFCVAFPALLLNYTGQGGHLIAHPEDITNAFYLSVPTAFFWPMLVVSTLAAIVASQAIITGSFSLVSQALGFGYFPPVKISHTNEKQMGQIYIPEVNFVLGILTLVVVVGFKHSAALAGAYGVAVSGVMFLTSILYTSVLWFNFRTKWWKILIYVIVFYTIDLMFFASNILKIPNGGWFPVVIGVILSVSMFCWHAGRTATQRYLADRSSQLPSWNELGKVLLDHSNKNLEVRRIPSVGVYLSSHAEALPESVRSLLPRTLALNLPCIFLTVKYVSVPYVADRERCVINKIPHLDSCFQILLVYGYMEIPHLSEVIPKLIENETVENGGLGVLRETLLPTMSAIRQSLNGSPITSSSSSSSQTSLDMPLITYYLGRDKIKLNPKRWFGHKLWVGYYDLMMKNSRNKASQFNIDHDDVLEIGTWVEL